MAAAKLRSVVPPAWPPKIAASTSCCAPARPRLICQDDTNWQMPKVDRPPARSPTLRHGQMASQLHASK